jgi:hypothetical protein
VSNNHILLRKGGQRTFTHEWQHEDLEIAKREFGLPERDLEVCSECEHFMPAFDFKYGMCSECQEVAAQGQPTSR